MGRVIVLNDAARAFRSPSVVQARRRHLQAHLQRLHPDIYEGDRAQANERSTGERIERLVCIIGLWALFAVYVIVRTPPDLGRSVVRFQPEPDQIAAPASIPEESGEVRLSRAESSYPGKR